MLGVSLKDHRLCPVQVLTLSDKSQSSAPHRHSPIPAAASGPLTVGKKKTTGRWDEK